MADKIFVGEVPLPPAGKWRAITQPQPSIADLEVWIEHMNSLGTNETRVDLTDAGYVLMAKRMPSGQ